ncbi:MAG: ABC transporter substrate-binding protein [Gammaproteobacteria bacterium]|nr:ABC transporter substrate-binding protein [Gammaproteobacteria bacterium]NIR85014.1 ABC transporter substrate-binding protein [Gammaproteobacteria bacterium]NIR88281.1 ABC transporter substrate-binding protein [Gammaproteobacteria bacterium]NIU06061.1 ABC transporter substrate-binding protein [Gammaproteobacteria bacterium]NIV73480.1 ABC transporter substrate-binding protein [Gammaproteobacteria bacterium]
MRTFRPVKQLVAAAALTLMGSGLAAAADSVSFRLDWTIYGTHAPFFLGMSEGLYADEGLDVTIKEGQGSGTVAQLIAEGSDPLGFVDYGTMVKGIAKGMPVSAVFGINQKTPMAIISHADNPIKAPKDLEGAVIAMNPAESTAQVFPVLLSVNDVERNKINILNPAVGAKSALFLQNRTDAITGYYTVQVAELEARGAETYYFSVADFGVNLMSNGIIANNRYLEENGDVVRRFLRANARAWKMAQADPEKAVDAIFESKPQLRRNRDVYLRQLKLTFETLETPSTKGEPLGWMSQQDWKTTVDLLVESGGIAEPVPVDRLYTNEYVPR